KLTTDPRMRSTTIAACNSRVLREPSHIQTRDLRQSHQIVIAVLPGKRIPIKSGCYDRVRARGASYSPRVISYCMDVLGGVAPRSPHGKLPHVKSQRCRRAFPGADQLQVWCSANSRARSARALRIVRNARGRREADAMLEMRYQGR